MTYTAANFNSKLNKQNDLLKTPQMGGGGSFVTSANYYNNQSSAIVQSTQEVLPFSSPTVSYGKSLGI